MIDKRIIDYIKTNLNKGYNPSSIQKKLLEAGYPPQNIIETIYYVQKNNKNIKQNNPREKNSFSQSQKPSENKSVGEQAKTTEKPKNQNTNEKKETKNNTPQSRQKNNLSFLKDLKLTKSLPKNYILFSIPVIIIIIIIISITLYLLFFTTPSEISEEEFMKGIDLRLKENHEINLHFENNKYLLRIDSIKEDSITFSNKTNPIHGSIDIRHEKRFDLDENGFYDMVLRLNEISGKEARIYIREINEEVCLEDWECEEWEDCTEKGMQTRECNDLNECEATENKPKVSRECEYVCIEDWECGEWEDCTKEGIQSRECNDLNECETTENKPKVSRECEYVCKENWHCLDWSGCVDGKMTRECHDLNECGTEQEKPETKQECKVDCTEQWECSPWGDCIDGEKGRGCYDANECGTYENRPITRKPCGEECIEEWECIPIGECIDGEKKMACFDINECGTEEKKPDDIKSC